MTARLRQARHAKVLASVLALLALALVGAFVGCGTQERALSSRAAPAGFAPSQGGGRAMVARVAASPAPVSEPWSGFEQAPATPWPTSPMVIRNASLDLRVDDVTKVQREIGRLARDAGGYVAGATLQSEGKPETAAITVRVPNQGLDDALERIAALGRLLSKKLTAQEVTEEYTDLSSRRRNLEREEGRLLDLLNRAGKVQELLEVEQQVSRVRGEIETTAGRMRYLENRVALSTIQVQLSGPEPPVSHGGPAWAATDVARQAFRSLRHTGRGLATLGIWLGVFAPLWLPVGLMLLWWSRRTAPTRHPAPAPAVGPIGPGNA